VRIITGASVRILFDPETELVTQCVCTAAEIFTPIRLETCPGAIAMNHLRFVENIETLSQLTATTIKVRVHSNISLKNIHGGPPAAEFVDAECA